jgi:hypothetical protein
MDERDLETLLSEPGLGQVMAALRAAPVPAELDREPGALAAYRMFLGAGASEPSPALPLAPVPGGPRPHRHRRTPRLGRWPVTVLLSGAAAVAGIIVLVLALSGPAGRGTPVRPPRDTHSATGSGGGQQAVEGKASATPTAQRPAPAASVAPATPTAQSRCHRSFAFRHDCAPSPGSGGGTGSSGGFGGFGGYGGGLGGLGGQAGRGQR